MNNKFPNSSQPQSPPGDRDTGSLDKLPDLRIVNLDTVRLHELHDNQRTPPLVESLKNSDLLTNPPIVTPMRNSSEYYMVLDGANRVSAFREVGLKHALVQVMEPDNPGLQMRTWNHVIWGMGPEELIDSINAIDGLEVAFTDDHEDALKRIWAQELLFYLQTPDLRVCTVKSTEDQKSSRLQQLHQVTETYKNKAKLDRTPLVTIHPLLDLYDQLTGVLVFPHFTVFDVLNICSSGKLMPAGITRSVIAPRALRVNYPVEALREETSLEEKNKVFKEWLKGRLAKRGVRFYQEPTMIFDE